MNTLSENQKKYNLLREIESHIKVNLGLTPCVGAEIEFYLSKDVDVNLLEKFVGHSIKVEKGNSQYEIDLDPSLNLQEYARYIEELRKKIMVISNELGGVADFTSKPYENDYGNSMHIHLNFLEEWDVEQFAKILCHYLSDSLHVFLPQIEDWKRLDKKFMAPTHICYGGNNRTVAIRIPDSKPKRIEHRVSAASADPALVIYEIMNSIAKGIGDKKRNYEYSKIYGNAFDPQYDLKSIG